jgi:hypothetical protein
MDTSESRSEFGKGKSLSCLADCGKGEGMSNGIQVVINKEETDSRGALVL